ncbi:MAG TPA: HsdR family type I site-specific deoxyribonuclease, partial [Aquella sp.]|nr:HsdR family type I site-specific deoxyribonuclease [Aquella sp.]
VPKRFLDLLQSFIIFDDKVKKVARYPQYFAIKDVLARIKDNHFTDVRAGGLIWHTQGSGKSLTMSMLTKAIKREIPNSRIIVVTDRIDLDNQIHDTFRNTEIKVVKANSGRDLTEKLNSGAAVITTLIHKFETIKNEKIINDPDIFVLVDESHRTQGGDLHKAMKKIFPKGCYIGFTGTPLLAKHKHDGTLAKFGGLIHKYTLEQALKDKTILPLLYEGRSADQWINDQAGLDRKFELITRNLNEAQKKDLQQKWARFSNIASSEHRLEMIALDINEHFKQNVQGTGFKAILATSSKYEAVKYHEIFERFGEIKTAFVISAPDTREGYSELDNTNKQYVNGAWSEVMRRYDNENTYLESVKSEFVNGDELELLIVVDKLLTGFDAPRAKVLYLDKNLKEHNLLQAIARVNRLSDGKECGFIIDYRGLLEDLGSALTAYSALAGFDDEDIRDTVFNIKDEIDNVKNYYSHLVDLFKPVKFKNDSESYQVYVADEKLRRKFYDLLSKFGITLKHVLSSDTCENLLSDAEISKYKNKMKFFIDLKQAVEMRYQEKIDFGKYEKEMQKLLDSYISADEVIPITRLIDIFDKDFSKELTSLIGDNAKADAIINAMSKVISENHEKNPFLYDKLSDQIKQIIENYKQGRLSDEEKLKHAHDIRNLLVKKYSDDKKNYPIELLSRGDCAKALFDNLSTQMEFLNHNELIALVICIDDIFRAVALKPDWQNNINVHNQIDQGVDDLLFDIEKRHNIKVTNVINDVGQLITQVRQIGINNYAG